MAYKKAYFSRVELYDSKSKKELDYHLLQGIYNNILDKNAVLTKEGVALRLNPRASLFEAKLMLDVINHDKDFMFGRISKQKENNTILKRGYVNLDAKDVFTPAEARSNGIEVFTYFLLDYNKGIFIMVSAQGAPKAKVLDNIFWEYNKDYYTEFVDIPNDEGIQVLFNDEEPEVVALEFDVTRPSAQYLQQILGLNETELFETLSEGVKNARIILSAKKYDSVEKDKKKVEKIIEILLKKKGDYPRLIIRGKGKEVKNQSFDLHAKYFSYPIDIKKTHVIAGNTVEFNLEELTAQFKVGLQKAYYSNYDLVVALADREERDE